MYLHSVVAASLAFTSKTFINLASFFFINTNQPLRGLRTLSKCTVHVTSLPRRFLGPKKLCQEAPGCLLRAPRQVKSARKIGTTPQTISKMTRRRPKTPSRRLQGAQDASRKPPRPLQTLQDASKTPSNQLKSEYDTASRMFCKEGCLDN